MNMVPGPNYGGKVHNISKEQVLNSSKHVNMLDPNDCPASPTYRTFPMQTGVLPLCLVPPPIQQGETSMAAVALAQPA
jgi:hypothetical protein